MQTAATPNLAIAIYWIETTLGGSEFGNHKLTLLRGINYTWPGSNARFFIGRSLRVDQL